MGEIFVARRPTDIPSSVRRSQPHRIVVHGANEPHEPRFMPARRRCFESRQGRYRCRIPVKRTPSAARRGIVGNAGGGCLENVSPGAIHAEFFQQGGALCSGLMRFCRPSTANTTWMYGGGRRIEHKEMAAKRRKKRRSSYVFAPFAPFCGHSFGPACGLCYGLLSKCVPYPEDAAPGGAWKSFSWRFSTTMPSLTGLEEVHGKRHIPGVA